MATAGVMVLKGVRGLAGASSEANRSNGVVVVHAQGGAYTTWCAHKVVHTEGGLWPLQESCSLRGVRGLAPASIEASRGFGGVAVHAQGGAHTRWCTLKVVHTQGGSHTRWYVATAGVL